MRVGINLCWLDPGVVGGSEQATVRTLDALAFRDPAGIEPVLFVLRAFAERYPALVERFETHVLPVPGRLKPLRVLAEHTWLPAMVRRHGIDLLHDAGGTSPGSVDIPRVLTIHDIQPLELPENFPPLRVAYLRRAVPRALEKATLALVPSAFVARTLVDRLDADPDRIRVVPWSRPPLDRRADEDLVRGRWGLHGRRYAVLPAITYPHKDHVTAVRAMAHLRDRHPDLRLVLAGGAGPAEQTVFDEIHELGLEGTVIRTGRLDSDTIVSLIAGADLVVFPSRYEGFGLPAVEAMALGVPLVVSDAGALAEVTAGAGAVVPAGDDVQMAVEMHRILDDRPHRDRLIAAGLDRAAAFDPARTAERTLAAYRSVAAGR